MCEIVKKNCAVEFLQLRNFYFFFYLIKIYSTDFFPIFPWGHRLNFKIDAIDGKKWDKFVAMQKNSAISINDLNTVKGTVSERHSHPKQYSSKPEKLHLVLKVSKKTENCFGPP